jgi:putative ABC transport system substrate-binding protein
MRRREFIAGLFGAAALPTATRAQQPMRRIGILWPMDEGEPVRKLWHAAFVQGLAELGWMEGRNLRIDVRWNPRTTDQMWMAAKELVDLQPDILVSSTGRLTRAIQQHTRTMPIVFVGAGDPLASGIVTSLSRPEGNTTGVTDIFPSIAGKWLELLKLCVPHLGRVALIFNPDSVNSIFLDSIEEAAVKAGAQYGVEPIKASFRNADEMQRAITAFAAQPAGGLIIVPPPPTDTERELINRLAIRYRMPAIYQDKSFAVEGGLLSYGADMIDMFRHGGPPYVDHILRGMKPGDLPVQFPTKFILTVNLKTAKATGLP